MSARVHRYKGTCHGNNYWSTVIHHPTLLHIARTPLSYILEPLLQISSLSYFLPIANKGSFIPLFFEHPTPYQPLQ